MKLFRTVLLSLLTALICLMPMAPVSASGTAAVIKSNQRIYYVYYRTCASSPWHCYGGYYQVNQAILAVHYFQYYGYQAYYR